LLVLNPTKADALVIENSALLSIPGSTLQVFSSHRNALDLRNSGEINVDPVYLPGGTLEAKNSAKFQYPNLIADSVKVSNRGELLIK
jgi:hypothetical protein